MAGSFYVYTCIGVALGILHVVLPFRHHHVGAASAILLGVAGAWNGALFAAAFVRGGWALLPAFTIPAAILAAAGTVEGVEILAHRLLQARVV